MVDARFEYISDLGSLKKKLSTWIAQEVPVACDTETTYDPDNNGVIRYIAGTPNNVPFCVTMSDGQEAIYIDVNEDTIPVIQDFFNRCKLTLWYNQKFDMHMLANIGITVPENSVDVAIIHNLYNEEDYDNDGKRVRSLKALAVKYISPDANKYEQMVAEVRKAIAKERGVPLAEIGYDDVDKDLMVAYACADTLYTAQLYHIFMPAIEVQQLLPCLEREMKALHAVFRVERNGMLIDKERLVSLKQEVEHNIADIKSRIFTLAGKEFNIDSANELVEVFHNLGVDYHFKTDKGEWRTDVAAMEYFSQSDNPAVAEFASAILEYRGESKLLNTFIANIEEYIQHDGRVHPDFWLDGTRTGRMSSSNPNFQNFPKSDKRIRELFIPAPGHIFIYMDAAQEEYRMLAHYAKDYKLIKAIKDGLDIHKATAAVMFNVPYDEVTKEQRDTGKRMNFAMVYGLGEAAIAANIGCKIDEITYKKGGEVLRRFNVKPWELPPKETILMKLTDPDEKAAVEYYYSEEVRQAIAKAKEFKQQYFSTFPKIQQFINDCRRVAQQRGYVKTWTGRRRRFRNPRQENYKAPNAVIQGGCGDILKDRCAAVDKFLQFVNSKWKIVNLVHDEIQFEVPIDELDLIPKVKDILQQLPFRVPITFDLAWSYTNWAEKKEASSVDEIKQELKKEGML